MKRNIVIFGFSGSGKSSVAKRVGAVLGLRVIHPSSILRDLIEGVTPDTVHTRANTGYWDSLEGMAVLRKRLVTDEPIDFTCDRLLVELLKQEGVVMDSWTMPWIAENTINIYLQASLEIRAARVAERSGLSVNEARAVISERDTTTRNLYCDRFDIAQDHQVFDYVIDTENLTLEEVADSVLKCVE